MSINNNQTSNQSKFQYSMQLTEQNNHTTESFLGCDPQIRVLACSLEEHTPRPANAFILYRKQMHKEMWPILKTQGCNNSEISKIVGGMWANESEEEIIFVIIFYLMLYHLILC